MVPRTSIRSVLFPTLHRLLFGSLFFILKTIKNIEIEKTKVFNYKEFEQNKSLIKEDVESTVYNAFKHSNLGKRFLILWMVPNDMISFKHKLGFIVSLLKNH